ncbi:MAG: hypothetical protein U5M50_16475 [Sphingobium sp.]|nr:hypothetical protein [Sphingobium sp.]
MVPEKARVRFRGYQRGGARFAEMDARRKELGQQRLYEGRCLALYLAPACDAVISRRFTLANYMGSLRNYASLMDEICLACAEEIAERQQQIGGNATDAFDSLCADDPRQLYERIIDRARQWRDGGDDQGAVVAF